MEVKINIGDVDLETGVASSLSVNDLVYHDIHNPPFDLYGVDKTSLPKFQRLPDDVAQNTSKGVFKLYKMTTGVRVRFATDSEYVAIKCKLPQVHHMPHMPLVASSGFDMYVCFEDGSSSFRAPFRPPLDMTDGYEALVRFKNKARRMIQINFPIANNVDAFYVGLQKDAALEGGLKYVNEDPVIFYGSSITHGVAASRPGNTYPAMVSRRLNLNYINLGFSGNAKAEQIMCDYLASLKTPLFVMDYDHNAPSAEYLNDTHYNLYKTFRNVQPETPIILMSRPSYHYNGRAEANDRRDVVYTTFMKARSKGDKNVYFIDGAAWLHGIDRNECTVDGTHPTDIGFYRMADIVTDLVHNILFKKDLMI